MVGGANSPGVLPVDVKYSLFGLVTFEGAPGENVGWSVAGGDLNGDGLDDLIIGATGLSFANNEGGVYVVYGSRRAFPRTFTLATMTERQGNYIQNFLFCTSLILPFKRVLD